MPTQIPLEPSIANYRIGVTIEDTQYLLDIRWNGREEKWYMDIYTEDETPIQHGIALVLGSVLGRTSTDPNFPAGAFVVSDLSNAGIDATFEDLGDRIVVYHYTEEELNTLS
jgi:hypothetical protein